jgi:glycosyltransferase involved in cell wall biosynthesis
MSTSYNQVSKGISIVIPVYNSEDILQDLVERLGSVLPSLTNNYELILINDGSRDNSWQVICALGEKYDWIRGQNLMRNYGQHNALLAGVRAAQNSIIVTIDDDLQHPPEEIHKLLERLDDGYDVVYGIPYKQQHELWRNLSSYITRLALQSTMGVENAQKVNAFRAFRTQLRDAFEDYRSPFVILDVLLTWGTTRFDAIPVNHKPRYQGKSNYTFRKLFSHAINMITGFTVLPLQLASWMGFTLSIFGVILLIYVIGRYIIQGGSVPGFPFLASTIAIFSGAQLFALGIIGEYLARIHFRIMDKPTYVIRKKHEQDKENYGSRE